MERKVIINVDKKWLPDVVSSAYSQAVGRTVLWALAYYDTVTIVNDSRNNMVAYYSDSKGHQEFTMGIIYDKDKNEFNYHS